MPLTYIPELVENAALLLALCFLQRFISERWHSNDLRRSIVSGLLFGGAAIVAMTMAIQFRPGIIFDSRTVVLSMGALFGGPIVAAISGAFAAGYRLYLGGAGAPVGISVIVVSLALGLLCRRYCARRSADIGFGSLLVLGLAVHLAAIVLFHLLPLAPLHGTLWPLLLPYVSTLSLASVVMGLLLREIEEARQFDRILGETRDRYEQLFRTSAVPMLEEDFTDVFRRLESLRAGGVTDLRAHLKANPDLLTELAASVRVMDANDAARRLFAVGSVRALRKDIAEFFGADARDTFTDEICAIWDGDERFEGTAALVARDGTPRNCIVSLPVPRTMEQARRVPVSLADISHQKETERQLSDERRRLAEILWGTNVGTWEWNVQTGETVFDDRWAEIVGYRLEELSPVSIKTWESLAHPDDLSRSGERLEEVFGRRRDHYECEARMRHKDGHWVWVLDRGKVVEWSADGRPLRMSGTHMDITERMRAQARARRLTEIRETLLRCHTAIISEDHEPRLFERLAAILAETRDYALVWIGEPQDDPGRIVRPIARAGSHASFLDAAEVRWSDDDLGRGPAGRAVRTRAIQIANDLAADETSIPWAAVAAAHGFKAAVASPIVVESRVVAVLNIYSDAPDAFDDLEIGLISQFCDHVGLAIRAMRLDWETLALETSLREAAFGAVRAVAATIEKRDPYTAGHQENVAAISVAIAERLGWSTKRVEGLRLGATIHDIGKIYIPAEILNRPGRLTESEFGMIKSHPQVGFDILSETSFPWPIQDMVVQHHERVDGSGYPKGLSGDQIIDEAKIIAVADVIDAITSHRPYRPGKGIEVALAEIERGRGTAYDPVIADTCLRLIRDEGFRWSGTVA